MSCFLNKLDGLHLRSIKLFIGEKCLLGVENSTLCSKLCGTALTQIVSAESMGPTFFELNQSEIFQPSQSLVFCSVHEQLYQSVRKNSKLTRRGYKLLEEMGMFTLSPVICRNFI